MVRTSVSETNNCTQVSTVGGQYRLYQSPPPHPQPTNHRPQADHLHKPIHHLRHRLRHDPRPPLHDRLLRHALLPQRALASHGREARLGLAPVVDVRLGTLEDVGSELESELGEALLNVVVEGVQEDTDEGEEEEGKEKE